MVKTLTSISLRKFVQSSSSGGIVLLVCVVMSLLLANSPWGPGFERLLASLLGVEMGPVHLRYTVLAWVNDGLMAIFFLLVGLEIKRELVEGQLSTASKAALPILAALGGVLAPAGIYTLFNAGTESASGWGIPMATDIAFALGIISLLGKKVPASLKIFLAALAIADDLMAILVIAVFYTTELNSAYLIFAALGVGVQVACNRLGFTRLVYYLVPGVVIWYFIHHSGVHATIAGVITAMTIPVRTSRSETSPLLKLEHALVTPVNFLIMPLFAFCNTNIRFEEGMVSGLTTPLGLGILAGLFIGKPVGITLATWAAVKLKLCNLPEKASWAQIFGTGMLGGIGFTMSIFIAMLSFKGSLHLEQEAKFSILIASLLSGIAGSIFLVSAGKRKQRSVGEEKVTSDR
jgi:NhaA family Na+:H+ antiporter